MNTDEAKQIFEVARKLYPHHKRGLDTEFANFCKHKDWKQALPLLKPNIERQIQWRREVSSHNYANPKFRLFVPMWKDFKSWIYNRYWELEIELPSEERRRKTEESKPIKVVKAELKPVPEAGTRVLYNQINELLKGEKNGKN